MVVSDWLVGILLDGGLLAVVPPSEYLAETKVVGDWLYSSIFVGDRVDSAVLLDDWLVCGVLVGDWLDGPVDDGGVALVDNLNVVFVACDWLDGVLVKDTVFVGDG